MYLYFREKIYGFLKGREWEARKVMGNKNNEV